MLKFLKNQQKNQLKRLERLKSYQTMNPSDLNDDQLKSIDEIPTIVFYLSKLNEMTGLMEEEEKSNSQSISELNDNISNLKSMLSTMNQDHKEQLSNIRLIQNSLYMILQLYNMPLSESDLSVCQQLERNIKLEKDFSINPSHLAVVKSKQSDLLSVYNRYFDDNHSIVKSNKSTNSTDKRVKSNSKSLDLSAVMGSQFNLVEGQSMFTKSQLPPVIKNNQVLIHFTGPHGTDIIHSCFHALSELSAKNQFHLQKINIHRAWHDVQVILNISVLHLDTVELTTLFDQISVKWHAQWHLKQLHSDSDYQFDSAPYPSRHQHMITILLPNTKNSLFSSLSAFIKICLDLKISIEVMRPLNKLNSAWEFRVSSVHPFLVVRKQIYQQMRHSEINLAMSPCSIFRKQRRLIIFDMDSTLIEQEVIDELAREYGVFDKVKMITLQAMQGKIDFKESLKQRVALLRNCPVSMVQQVCNRLTLTNGALELCLMLKKLGFTTAVLSGGFEPFLKYISHLLPIDHYFGNNFNYQLVEDEKLIDGLSKDQEIVDGQRKADLLQIIAQSLHVDLNQVVCIGDGSNDIPMLKIAGLGIAWNAKSVVENEIESKLNGSLLNVMYLMGYNEDEINELSIGNELKIIRKIDKSNKKVNENKLEKAFLDKKVAEKEPQEIGTSLENPVEEEDGVNIGNKKKKFYNNKRYRPRGGRKIQRAEEVLK
eukprot:NODE_145_length_17646_cov_0.204536.p1 type:complete len:709 gc:universal NODE_145_length_17646_cov_0.204536:11004-8878(-)